MSDKFDGYPHRPQRFVSLPIYGTKYSMGGRLTDYSKVLETRIDMNRVILAEQLADLVVALHLETGGGTMVVKTKLTLRQFDDLILNGRLGN